MPRTEELHTAAENGRVADVERLIAARADLKAKDDVSTARRVLRTASPLPPPAPPAASPLSHGTVRALCGGRDDRSGRGAENAESGFSRPRPDRDWGGDGGAGGAGGGADRAGPGQNGLKPLHLAAMNGHWEVAEKLLAAGADIGATNNVRDPGGGGRRGFTRAM